MDPVPVPPRSNRSLLIKLSLASVLGLVIAALVLRGMDVRSTLDQALAWIRSVGPVPYFLGMAILPAFGFPLLAFSLSAGPVFAPQIGLGWVVLLVALSIGANVALTYWLARYALRPFLEALIKRLGYQLPKVDPEDYVSLSVLMRVTPGPPFTMQGYLLGLAGVPFGIYMAVSWPIAAALSIALVIFGDSLAHGKGKVGLIAFSLIVAFAVGVRWLRKRYARRKAAGL
jgi:uncharacterized membrane protein YdjX (TVP38/TMEM64 family)